MGAGAPGGAAGSEALPLSAVLGTACAACSVASESTFFASHGVLSRIATPDCRDAVHAAMLCIQVNEHEVASAVLCRREEVLAEAASPARRRDERQAMPAARPGAQAALQVDHQRERHLPALPTQPQSVGRIYFYACLCLPITDARVCVASARQERGRSRTSAAAAAQLWHRPSAGLAH